MSRLQLCYFLLSLSISLSAQVTSNKKPKLSPEGISIEQEEYKELLDEVKNNNIETVRELLQDLYRQNVNTQDPKGFTPLHFAVQNGNLKMVQLLIDAKANVNTATDIGFGLETPLHLAARDGHLEVAKLLIHAGADVNAKNESDNTPLQEAAEQNHFNLVHLLVQAGADVNSINEHHETPLFQAVSNNNLQVVDLLLNNGVDVNVKDIANENILRFTMANFRFLDPLILKALLRHGINFADSKKYEELVILAFPDSPRMVSDILTPAPQVTQSNELKDTEGNSIIVYISGQGQYDKLKPLMQLPVYREDMLSLNEALKMAIYCITNNTITHKQRQAYQEIINLLVTYGAKVDSHDFSTKKLFFKAAKTNNVPIIDLFLQAGIDPLLQNQNGKTAVEIANEYGNTKIIDALAKKIAINLNLANTKNDTKASSILEEFINKVSPAIGLLIGSYFMSIAKQKNLQLA